VNCIFVNGSYSFRSAMAFYVCDAKIANAAVKL
jgi:hypothetical protein